MSFNTIAALVRADRLLEYISDLGVIEHSEVSAFDIKSAVQHLIA